jgi:hypothetical protein
MVNLAQVSNDTWIQVLALIVTTCVAIGGAVLGAKIGANATRAATREAVAAERAAEAQRRREADRDALRALAAECRLNARLLREVPRPHEAAAPIPFLERAVSDWALPVFHVLPGELRARTDALTNDVIYVNTLLRHREQLAERQVIDRSFDAHIQSFARSLPEALDDLASKLERFAAAD